MLILGLLLLTAPAMAQDSAGLGSDVELRIAIFLVDVVDGAEFFTESVTAHSGATVEYRIFATNRGTQELQAGTVEVFCPIPAGVEFQENSVTPNSDRVLIEFTADGSTFSAPPLLTGQDGSRAVVPTEEYRGVRWTLLESMAPGQEEVFTFRVTIQ